MTKEIFHSFITWAPLVILLVLLTLAAAVTVKQYILKPVETQLVLSFWSNSTRDEFRVVVKDVKQAQIMVNQLNLSAVYNPILYYGDEIIYVVNHRGVLVRVQL